MSQVLFFIVFVCANGGRLPLLKELKDSWSGSGDLMSADLANWSLLVRCRVVNQKVTGIFDQ